MSSKSIWYSVFVLGRDTVRHWLLFVGGALASLAGWVLQARGTNLPTSYFLYGGGILLAVAVVRAWHDLRVNRDQLVEDRAPKFEIIFAPKNDTDSRPYVQTLRFQKHSAIRNVVGGTLVVTDMADRRFRIGIVNLSSATVANVTATLQSCTPGGNFIHVGHHLLVMDSDPPVAQRDLPPSTNGEPTLFFDVVNECGPDGDVPASFLFCYANPGIVGEISGNSYEITVRVDGGNVSTTKRFRIRKSWNPTDLWGKLVMEELRE